MFEKPVVKQLENSRGHSTLSVRTAVDNEILYCRFMVWAGIAVALFACHTMSGWKKLVDKSHKTSRECLDVADGWRGVAEHYKGKYARMVDTFGELPGDESEE